MRQTKLKIIFHSTPQHYKKLFLTHCLMSCFKNVLIIIFFNVHSNIVQSFKIKKITIYKIFNLFRAKSENVSLMLNAFLREYPCKLSYKQPNAELWLFVIHTFLNIRKILQSFKNYISNVLCSRKVMLQMHQYRHYNWQTFRWFKYNTAIFILESES